MDKYKDNPKAQSSETVFPVLSNQRMNGYLKEIADPCDISKKLTFHIARYTFATTVTLRNGVPNGKRIKYAWAHKYKDHTAICKST